MKKLLLSHSVFFIPYFLFSQNVGIGTTTPVTKLHVVSSIGNVATFSGASPMYITLAEGANNRGYIGSFAGNPEDVDFGTYGGNATGKVHLTIQDVPKLTVNASGNIGIGTIDPLSLLHVTNGAILFDGTTGVTPVAGAGTRLMWIPAKAAFRAGAVSGTQWNDANIGLYSFATGNGSIASAYGSIATGVNTTASYATSTAMGEQTVASGLSSTAMGEYAIASGSYSTAMGYGTIASNYGSTAMGVSTTASGDRAIAMGEQTIANGYNSTAMGVFTTASGTVSIAMGEETTASGYASSAMGQGTKSKSYGGLTAGLYNDSTNAANPTGINSLNRIFQIGNGTADNARSNAMTVLQNGNVGIGELNPGVPLNFANTLGDKISLYGNTGAHYGFGILNNLLQMHTDMAASDIAFGWGSSSSFNETMRIKGTGDGSIKGNLTVQNGKGLIRNTDGTQSKKLSTTVTVNTTFTAGQTQSFAVSWPESFTAGTIEAYVGNVTGGSGGWAEVVMTVTNVTTTGAFLYVYNPKTISVSPNFTIKVIAIGPQ